LNANFDFGAADARRSSSIFSNVFNCCSSQHFSVNATTLGSGMRPYIPIHIASDHNSAKTQSHQQDSS
jgi:hypothetical protein